MAKTYVSQEPGTVEKLADWSLAVRTEEIPQATLHQAKLLLLDTIGCGYAALDEVTSRAVIATMAETGGAPQCTVIGGPTRTSAPGAVLLNGALIRILDLNDYANTKSGQIGGHPSDNIPVALAAGELAGASGRDVLAAIVVGYEIYGRLKEAMQDANDWDGIMVSGFAAPAMAARLMGLDRLALANALALSGARAPTPLAVRHGAISAAKSVANALVAQNGMQAAILAKHGMTGPLDLFENPHGLGSLFPTLDGSLTAPLATDCYLMGCHVKAYPCLATGQSIVHAGLDIHRQVGRDIGRLRQVTVAIADTPSLRRQKDDPGRIDPNSREAADHSFNFLAAVAIVDGAIRPRPVRQRALERCGRARRHGAAGDRLRPDAERPVAGRLPLRDSRQGRGRNGLQGGGARSARLLAARARRRCGDGEIPCHHREPPAAGRTRPGCRERDGTRSQPKRCRCDCRASRGECGLPRSRRPPRPQLILA